LLYVILALGLVAAALAAALGFVLVHRRLARPLQAMREPLERLTEGDLEARVEVPEAGQLAALAGTLNRMSERLSEQVRTSREEQRIRDLILSSMEEGVLLADEHGDVVFANPSMERHLGGRPRRVQDLFPGIVREAVRGAADGGRPEPVEVEVDRPPRWLRGSAVPLGPEGSVLLVLRDVTEARRIDRVRRDFVTNASHELKTPAAGIQAVAETIRSAAHDDPSMVPRFARQLEREAVRLTRIVADLLDLSRLESGSELAETLDLATVVREEAGRFAERAAELTLRLSIEADGRTGVRGSARDLGLLVRNLVDNAVRHTRPGGRIEIRLVTEDDSAVLRVADTGIGIPTRDLPRVFERFYRVDRARSRETGGTGLGLSIVKHVAENHGGRVDVSSELGRGSEFVVRLPLARGG
jgi:two-component system, OmpR family, phosphate regulon sensor histidine kinase PhoR